MAIKKRVPVPPAAPALTPTPAPDPAPKAQTSKKAPRSAAPAKKPVKKVSPPVDPSTGEAAPKPESTGGTEPRTTAKKSAAPTRSAATRSAATRSAATRSAAKRSSANPSAGKRSSAKRQPAKKSGAAATAATVEKPLRILMVTSEAHPFAKTGGLAEVAAALPAALGRLGHQVTVVLPRYRGAVTSAVASREIRIHVGRHSFDAGFIEQPQGSGVTAVLVDIPALFDRTGLYGQDGRDYPDNALRFAFLARAALEYARSADERYDVIHAHDWQAGLVPVYQKMLLSTDSRVGGVPVVFTIHNLAFQGIFGAETVGQVGLGWEVLNPEALEYWGNISYLKGGVNFSERITTVSPTYAREILTPEFGFGLEGVIRKRQADLIGILNGIDTERWNPAADPFVPTPFTADDLSGKQAAKRLLLEESGIEVSDATLQRPLIGMISRLTDQKGFDLIGTAATELMALDATWVMLGSGERHYEDLWRTMASRHPDRVAATIGFSERLAHLIEAGADMFLMPSRFEPCGLNQLYSLRYGTVPIVRATGGLEDSVVDAAAANGNGIKFAEYTRGALVGAVRRALELYADRPRWAALQQAGMATNPSWDVSALEYVKVYRGQR